RDQWRRIASRRRIALSGALPHREAGVDRGRVGDVGAGSESTLLYDHSRRAAAAQERARALRGIRRGRQTHPPRLIGATVPTMGRVGRQLRSHFWRASVAEEVDAELDFHVEMVTRELVELGMDRDAARAEAIRRFGDLRAVTDTCRRLGTEREHEMKRTQ